MTSRSDFYRDSADAQALEQARNLASKKPLPLTARSLSAEEIAAIDRRIYPILFGLYGVGAVGILSIAWFGGEHGSFPIAAIVALALFVPLALFARFRAGRRKDYRDPLQSVEASADGVTIRDAGRTARIDYRDVAVTAFLLLGGAKSRVLFLGVLIDGPFGAVRLENMAYKDGTLVAAAIVAERHALGLGVVTAGA